MNALRDVFQYCLLVFAMVAVCGIAPAATERMPNFVLIVADDLGFADVGFNGCQDFQTPHIDRIAKEGVRFTNGYVSYPVCGPSRAGLMTGRYQDRFGFWTNPVIDPKNPSAGLPTDESTIAEALRPAGYRSMAIGKWHLGTHPDLHPLERGFDEFFGFLSGGHNYFPEDLNLRDLSEVRTMWGWYRTKLQRDREPVEIHEYLTDELSNEAVSFVTRSAEQPFFLYLAYNAPHTPLQATEAYLQRVSNIKDRRRRTYAAMVTALDDGVGRVLDELEQTGVAEDTLVIFLSDNGGPTTANGSRNDPLRGGKGSQFEGGVRVPFAARWPRRWAAGQDYTQPVISLDIFATIAAHAGVTGSLSKPLDGVDLTPYVRGERTERPHPELFWRDFSASELAARSGDEKLLVGSESRETQLFDLQSDIGESNDLARQRRQRVAAIQKKVEAWSGELKDPAFPSLGSWQPPDQSASVSE